jgi:hypothetical protein
MPIIGRFLLRVAYQKHSTANAWRWIGLRDAHRCVLWAESLAVGALPCAAAGTLHQIGGDTDAGSEANAAHAAETGSFVIALAIGAGITVTAAALLHFLVREPIDAADLEGAVPAVAE